MFKRKQSKRTELDGELVGDLEDHPTSPWSLDDEEEESLSLHTDENDEEKEEEEEVVSWDAQVIRGISKVSLF